MIDDLSGKRHSARLAADADEVEDLRESLRAAIEEAELIPGDGSDPDPFCEDDERAEADDEHAELADDRSDTTTPIDLQACQATFTAVLGAHDRLARELPQHVESLTSLARAGQAALEHPETGQAAELWDRLSDRMFELGVYL